MEEREMPMDNHSHQRERERESGVGRGQDRRSMRRENHILQTSFTTNIPSPVHSSLGWMSEGSWRLSLLPHLLVFSCSRHPHSH